MFDHRSRKNDKEPLIGLVSLRLTLEEHDAIKTAALSSGLSLNNWIRDALAAKYADQKPKKRPRKGASR